MPYKFPTLRRWTNDEIKSRVRQQFVIGFGRGYLEDTLDNMIVTNEEEEVNEEERRSKSDEDKAKAKGETGASKVNVSQYF